MLPLGRAAQYKMKNNTGKFTVHYDLSLLEYQGAQNCYAVERTLIVEMMSKYIYPLIDDKRAYVVQSTKTEVKLEPNAQGKYKRLMLSTLILLHDPKEAEVGEYVTLGSVETLIKDIKTFIHLGNDLMFAKDGVGWRRVRLSNEKKEEIHHEVKRLRDEDAREDIK